MKFFYFFILLIPVSLYPLFEPVDFEGDIWKSQGIYISPAFIHSNFGISTEYIIPFGLSELATERLALRIPSGIGSFALRVSNFGEHTYRENEISIGYGNSYKSVKFGSFIKLLYVSTKEYGTSYAVSGDIGIMTTLKFSSIWLTLSDFTNPYIKDDAIDSKLAGGIYISPEDWFDIDVRILKQEGFETSTKITGIIHLSKFLTTRVGMNTSPRSFITGAALYINNFGLSYIVTTHQDLGLSHIISFSLDR